MWYAVKAVRFAVALACVGVLLPGPAAGGDDAMTVSDCVRLAVAHSPAARAATFAADAAGARLRAASAAYGPRLFGQGQYGRSHGFDNAITNGGATAALLSVELTLMDGGLRDAQFAAARARLRSATAMEQQRRAEVALAVRTAYFTALDARASADVHQDSFRLLRNAVDLLQRQESRGLVTHDELLRAQLALQTVQAAERATASQLAAARSELGALTGIDASSIVFAEPEAMSVVAATDASIDASPVMLDARAAADAARRDADAARSEWRSHLTLTADGGALGVEPETTFRDNRGGQFLFGFTVPLFDGGAPTARIAAAVADANGAAAAAEQSRQTIVIALAHAEVDARHAQADLEAWQHAAPQAAETFQLMRARYFGGGSVRLLEVLDALTQHVETRLNVSRARLAYRLAVATQYQILGETMP